MLDGEDFEYWKDRLESFFLGHDADLWDMVLDGYTHPEDKDGNKIDRKNMDKQQNMRKSPTKIQYMTCLSLSK